MAHPSRDRISVDLRGLRATVFEHARRNGVSPSDFVRSTLAKSVDCAPRSEPLAPGARSTPRDRVRLTIRLTRDESRRLEIAARSAGVSRTTCLVGLLEGLPVATQVANQPDVCASLVRSSDELSTLSRDLRHLTDLLRQGSLGAAFEYRALLDTLDGDVRKHLLLVSTALVAVRPPRRSPASQPTMRGRHARSAID